MAGPTFGASGTATGGGTRSTISLAAPASVVADSVVVAVIFVDGGTNQNPTLAGWAHVTGSPVAASDHQLYVLWHRATGSEAGPYGFVLNTSQYCEGQVHRLDGVTTSGDPFEAANTATVGSGAGTNATPNVAVTTLGADRLLLHAATNWSGGTWTPPASPAGFTKRQQIAPDGISTLATAAFASAGSTGNVSATSTGAGRATALLAAFVGASVAVDPPPRGQFVVPRLAAIQRASW